MTKAEFNKLGIESVKDLSINAPYMGFVRLGNTTAHDFVKEELVQKLKKRWLSR